jgi:3-oxoacyl-[acyl-carrier protein] reductase
MDLGLADHVYLITGGSRGLGLATAKVLTREGAKVIIAARDSDVVDHAVTELGPDNCVGLVGDIADPNAAERLVAATVGRFGRIDGGLLSVGGPIPGTALTTDDAAWRDAFETIFLGPLRVARAIASAIVADPSVPSGRAGSLAFVLSTTARSPKPGLALSNGLRPGLAMVVKDLSDELAPRGIRVNALLPGGIATDRVFALDARAGSPELVRRRNEGAIPLQRYGEPEEFGRVAAFVLSPAASYITGSAIPVDGGALRTI